MNDNKTTKETLVKDKFTKFEQHLKPKLTIDEQLEHLKAKGIKFELCKEEDARDWLSKYSYYMDICSYRSLFEKHVGGKHDGEYVNLDFAYLVDLWEIDREIRHTFLPLTLDIEHCAKAKLLRLVTNNEDEDGYSIIKDYFSSLDSENQKRRNNEIKRLQNDPYNKDLIRKYENEMPIWVIVNLWSFGTFIDFYRFCADRWNDKTMKQEHYMLRFVKSARNSYAHSSCILVDFGRANSHLQTHIQVLEALASIGINKNKRKKKLQCTSIQQISTVAYMYSAFDNTKENIVKSRKAISLLIKRMCRHMSYYNKNSLIQSNLEFIIQTFTLFWQHI